MCFQVLSVTKHTWNCYRTVKISYYCNPTLATYCIISVDGKQHLNGLSDMYDFVCDLEAVEIWASGRENLEHCWESGSSGMLKGQSMEAGNGWSWSDHRNEKCVYVTICVHVHIHFHIFSYLGIWNYNLVSSDFEEKALQLLFYSSLFNFISFCSLVINRIDLFRIAWIDLFICPQYVFCFFSM